MIQAFPNYDKEEVRTKARGRWPEILIHLAGIDSELLDDSKEHPCPKCGGTTRFRMINILEGAAGVKVSEAEGKTKYASAHDFRRAFGLRWSRLIMPTELKEVMRHENIATTMQFYVGQDAKQTVKKLRQASANTLANTSKNSPKPEKKKDCNPL